MSITGSEDGPPRQRLGGRKIEMCVVALLAAAATALLFMLVQATPTSLAQSVQPGPSGERFFAVAGQITPGTYGLYLVDPDRGGLVVYEYVPVKRQLVLRAARTCVYDLQLESYNTSPQPSEIAALVREARKIPEGDARPD